MSTRDHLITRYTRWLAAERGVHFDASNVEGYDALWRWSVSDLRGFWGSIWDKFGMRSPTPFSTASTARSLWAA